MADAIKRYLSDVPAWGFKGIVIGLISLSLFVFNDMRTNIEDIRNEVRGVSNIMIRLEGKVETHDVSIKENRDDIKRLERDKSDKK